MKMAGKNPMMFQVEKGPLADLEGVMNEINEITEEIMPKPQVTRPSKLSRKREIPSPNLSLLTHQGWKLNLEVGEEAEHDELDDGVEQQNKASNIRFEIANCELSRKVAKLQNIVNNGLKRLRQERLQHEQVTAILVEKGQAYEDELDQQIIKLKVS